MANITVVVADPPYGKERLYTTFRFALAALNTNHRVNLFLLEDAVCVAKKGQNPPEFPGLLGAKAMPNCGEMLTTSIKQGAQAKICGVCASERGLKQREVVDGANIGSMHDLVDWVANSDKVIFF